MFSEKDPIVATATAPGRGGIGIVRISGPAEKTGAIAGSLFPGRELPPRHAGLLSLRDGSGNLIDHAIVILYSAPHSYTGEEVLEIQAHGGPAVLDLIVGRCLEAGRPHGLRLAQPGEFTQRAFLNGRIDLAQAEAVSDLIESGSAAAARAAARSLQGALSERVRLLADTLADLRAYVESTLDFPDEDIEFINEGRIREKIQDLLVSVRELSRTAMRGKVLRNGFTVVLAGAPNVGKSSLMNRLAGEDVAIVTDVAGTTRDRIEHTVSLDGIPVNLIDTAGVRITDDPVERIGVERTLAAVETADAVLLISDAAGSSGASGEEALSLIRSRLREGVAFVRVTNKMDLHPEAISPSQDLSISVRTGEGMDELASRLKSLAGGEAGTEPEFLACTRHLDCLARAESHLVDSLGSLAAATLEIAAEELRLAQSSLGEIVGETVPDDILGRIFSKFCIGK